MSGLASTLEVARWEFRRYFKPRQQIIGIVVMALAGAATVGIVRLSQRSGDEVADIAVIATPGATLPQPPETIRLTQYDASADAALRDSVAGGDVDGLLHIDAAGSAQLLVRRERAWIGSLRTSLDDAHRSAVLQRENIRPEAFASALSPTDFTVVIHDDADGTRSRGSRFAFVVIVSLMLMSIFTGMGYIFASITGEKQIRVTEQVMSAIPAQNWIDGKIVGITVVSIVSVLSTVGGFVLLFFLLRVAGVSVPVPGVAGDPVMLLIITLFAVLGLLLWLSFLAGIAAMIDDPHTSTRGSWLMLPVMASGLAFLALNNPDSGLIRTLALLPPTASSVMPARMLLTDVPVAETMLALALLIGAVLALRIAAARVFRLAMLMYGKEPTWAEVRRWVMSP